MKHKSFVCIAVLISFVFFVSQAGNGLAAAGFNNPVAPLPSDNLIDFSSAWMRDSANTADAGYGRWNDESGHLALSCKPTKNPSPDTNCGTMMQWDSQVQTAAPLFPGEQAWVTLEVDAPPVHSGLKFQRWHVGRGGAEMLVIILGFNESTGIWEEVWRPIDANTSLPYFEPEQSPLYETAVSTAYSKYLIKMGCYYTSGVAGCKATGFYFAASSPATATPTATGTAGPSTTPTAVPTETPSTTTIHIHLAWNEMLSITCEVGTPVAVEQNGTMWAGCE